MNYEELKQQTEKLITLLGVTPREAIWETDEKTGTSWYRLYMDDARMILGRDNEVLTALNHIVRKLAEKMAGETELHTIPVMIDVNNVQKKHIESIHAIGHMMAERARFFKSSIELDPMSPYDRRIIHEFLADARDLTTESAGVGRDRHVVIKYVSNTI